LEAPRIIAELLVAAVNQEVSGDLAIYKYMGEEMVYVSPEVAMTDGCGVEKLRIMLRLHFEQWYDPLKYDVRFDK